MKQRLILMGFLLFAVFGGILNFNLIKRHIRDRKIREFVRPPISVSESVAKAEVWQPTLPAVGSLVAVQGVNVTTQASGKVTAILFQDGQNVEEGDLLVRLDDSVEQAQLENAQAAQALAQNAVNRYRPLLRQGAISPFRMDKLVAKLKESKAQVAQAQGQVDHLNIKAPFKGRLGIRQVDLGEYVKPGQALVRLDSQGSLFVDFTLTERYLEDVFLDQEVTVTSDAVPGKEFTGKITAISPQVDETTRSFSLRATIPNKGNVLTPGLFAQVEVHLKEEKDVVTVPQTAVSYSLYGDTVYIIEDSGKKEKGKPVLTVKRLAIQPGMKRKDEVAIISGVNPNDRVVTSGQLKLQNGSRVQIKPGDPLKTPETMPLQ